MRTATCEPVPLASDEHGAVCLEVHRDAYREGRSRQ